MKQIKQPADGTTNFFQHPFMIYTSYKERRFGIIVWSDASSNRVAQVFPLPIGQNPQPTTEWSRWQRPDYIEKSKLAEDTYIYDVKSVDRSTNIPPNCFEIRYKSENAK